MKKPLMREFSIREAEVALKAHYYSDVQKLNVVDYGDKIISYVSATISNSEMSALTAVSVERHD